MPIVFCSLEIYLPYSRSLKEKRNVVRKTADRLRARLNFSVAEIDYQNLHRRARLGAVSVGPVPVNLERVSNRLIRESEKILGGDLVDYHVDIFDHD